MLKRVFFALMLLLTFDSLSAMGNTDGSATGSSDTNAVNNQTDNLISRNFFIEIGGPSLGIGIGYDQRFKHNDTFGFRVGISYTNGSSENGSWSKPNIGHLTHTQVDFKGVTLPLEVNGILGETASKFELGFGATPCILYRTDWQDYHFTNQGVTLNIFGTLNIGYRLQRKSVFFLRAGLTCLLGNLKYSPMDGLFFSPNLCLGYTIR